VTTFEPVVLATARLRLYELSPGQAGELLLGRQPVPGVAWSAGYPLAGTRIAAIMLTSSAEAGAWRPGFGIYQIVLAGAAVGDIGFHGAPVDGRVEIGYGLAAPAHGRGLATEALTALGSWALDQPEVAVLTAETDRGNLASQRVLTRAGFRHLRDDDVARYFELTAEDRYGVGAQPGIG